MYLRILTIKKEYLKTFAISKFNNKLADFVQDSLLIILLKEKKMTTPISITLMNSIQKISFSLEEKLNPSTKMQSKAKIIIQDKTKLSSEVKIAKKAATVTFLKN